MITMISCITCKNPYACRQFDKTQRCADCPSGEDKEYCLRDIDANILEGVCEGCLVKKHEKIQSRLKN